MQVHLRAVKTFSINSRKCFPHGLVWFLILTVTIKQSLQWFPYFVWHSLQQKKILIKPKLYCYSKYDYIFYSCGYPQYKETNLHKYKNDIWISYSWLVLWQIRFKCQASVKRFPPDINLSHPYILLRKFIFQHLRKYFVFFSYISPCFLG